MTPTEKKIIEGAAAAAVLKFLLDFLEGRTKIVLERDGASERVVGIFFETAKEDSI